MDPKFTFLLLVKATVKIANMHLTSTSLSAERDSCRPVALQLYTRFLSHYVTLESHFTLVEGIILHNDHAWLSCV